MTQTLARFQAFKALHEGAGCFVMPNAWDAGSARLLASMGFQALATTSAGYAFCAGKRDSFAGLSRGEILANAADIVQATELPVSADLEDGFGATPEECGETMRLAVECGLVGGSLEDATGNPDAPIRAFADAVERVEAAAEAVKGKPFLLTARAENYLWGRHDLDDTIRRLQAFSEAGADVLYAPGLPDLDAIRTVCREVDRPVNVVMGLKEPSFSVQQLAEAGVRRVSVGGSFARAAFGGLKQAAQEVLGQGTFSYAQKAMPGAELFELMSDGRPDERT